MGFLDPTEGPTAEDAGGLAFLVLAAEAAPTPVAAAVPAELGLLLAESAKSLGVSWLPGTGVCLSMSMSCAAGTFAFDAAGIGKERKGKGGGKTGATFTVL